MFFVNFCNRDFYGVRLVQVSYVKSMFVAFFIIVTIIIDTAATVLNTCRQSGDLDYINLFAKSVCFLQDWMNRIFIRMFDFFNVWIW